MPTLIKQLNFNKNKQNFKNHYHKTFLTKYIILTQKDIKQFLLIFAKLPIL